MVRQRSTCSRRHVLKGAGLATIVAGSLPNGIHTPVAHAGGAGIVALDHALVQTLLVLGIAPAAVTGGDFYRKFVIEPAIPPGIIELGSRAEPNLELMKELRPRAIAFCPEFGSAVSSLNGTAPTLSLPIFTGDGHPLANARRVLRNLADFMDVQARARDYEWELDRSLAQTRAVLHGLDVRSVQVIGFSTGRVVRLFTSNSLFADTLRDLGLGSVLPGGGNLWGFADVGAESLAAFESQWMVHLGPIPERMRANPIWKALPFVRADRLVTIPPMWMFGGLPSAERFARTLVAALRAHRRNG